MESDEIWLVPGDFSVPAHLSGRVVRILNKSGGIVTEVFCVALESDKPPEYYRDSDADLSEVLDVAPFQDVPGWDPALIYRRTLPPRSGEDDETYGFLLAGNLASETLARLTIDLRVSEPLDIDAFWELMARLHGRATRSRVKLLRTTLAQLSETEIVGFAVTLWSCVAQLGGTSIQRPDYDMNPMLLDDSELYRRMAIVAKGRGSYEQARAGLPLVLEEEEWEHGERLVDLPELAYQDRTGVAPEFELAPGRRVAEVPSSELFLPEDHPGPYPTIYGLDGKGDTDLRPGPRTGPEMYARGLIPAIVGSRFLVSGPSGHIECVVMQRIDVLNENVALHLREAAELIANRLDGVVASHIESTYSHNPSVEDGLPVLIIRRRWSDTAKAYRAKYLP